MLFILVEVFYFDEKNKAKMQAIIVIFHKNWEKMEQFEVVAGKVLHWDPLVKMRLSG